MEFLLIFLPCLFVTLIASLFLGQEGLNASYALSMFNMLLLLFLKSDLFSDFDFSTNNQYIASSSMDKTVRVWDISRGLCIRVIYGVSSQLCIRFHPVSGQRCTFWLWVHIFCNHQNRLS